MTVRFPKPEQLLVWQRILKRIQTIEDGSWTGESVMAALERLRTIVDTLLVDQVDIDWLDDRFLDGSIDFKKLAPFLTQVTEAFVEAAAEEGNREQRRKAKKVPAKKTVRKKASNA